MPIRMTPAAWAVVAAAAASISLALGVRQTFGLFMLPLADEAGLSPAVLGMAVAAQNLVWGIATPFAGLIADRFGWQVFPLERRLVMDGQAKPQLR